MLALLLLGATHSAISQPWKKLPKAAVKTLQLGEFTKINSSLPVTLYVTQGAKQSVTAESRFEGLVESLDISVKGGTLTLTASPSVLKAISGLRSYPVATFMVTLPTVEGLYLNSSGDIIVQNDLRVKGLVLKLNGSGTMRCNAVDAEGDVRIITEGSGDNVGQAVRAQSLVMKLEGSGDMHFHNVDVRKSLELSLLGSGDVSIRDAMVGGDAIFYLNGSGDVSVQNVTASDSVSAEVNGSGSLKAQEISAEDMLLKGSGSGDLQMTRVSATGSIYLWNYGSGDLNTGQNGSARSGDIRQNGSGGLYASGLKIGHARVKVMGSGDLRIFVEQTLHILAGTRASTVYLSGDPKVTLEPGANIDLNRVGQ